MTGKTSRHSMGMGLIVAVLTLGLLVALGCKSGAGNETRTPGEIAFNNNCRTCHRLPKATEKTDAEWPTLVAHYAKKANLSQEKIDQITSYLIANN